MSHEKEMARPVLLVQSEELSYDAEKWHSGDSLRNVEVEFDPATEVFLSVIEEW